MSETKDKLDEGALEMVIPSRDGWTLGYEFIDGGGVRIFVARRDDETEVLPITNTEFLQWDEYLNHLLLAALLRKVEEVQGRKVRVLEAAGGPLSASARGMLKHPALAGRLHVTNIDMFAQEIDPAFLQAEGIDPDDLKIVNGDVIEQKGLDGAFDIVFAMGVVDVIRGDRLRQFMWKITEALAPGGEAFANDRMYRIMDKPGKISPYFVALEKTQRPLHWFEQLTMDCGVNITSVDGDLRPDGINQSLFGTRKLVIHLARPYQEGLPFSAIPRDFSHYWAYTAEQSSSQE